MISLLRMILFAILFYLVLRFVRNLIISISSHNRKEMKNNTQQTHKRFDPNEIEDIDYEEVDRK